MSADHLRLVTRSHRGFSDRETGRALTIGQVGQLVSDGEPVVVRDAFSGADVTTEVLPYAGQERVAVAADGRLSPVRGRNVSSR